MVRGVCEFNPKGRRHDLKVEEHRIRYKVGQTFRFVTFGDLHLGHRLCSVSNFKKEIIDKYKDDKDTFFFDVSDECDMILAQTNDPRFKASMIDPRYLTVDGPVDVQIQDVCDLYAPIAGRLLGICACNHHDAILKRTATDPGRRICYTLWQGKEAEKRNLAWENFISIRFTYDVYKSRSRKVSWYLSHGITTGTRTEGGHITSIGNVAMNYGDTDIFCFGHNHQLDTWDRLLLVPNYRSKKVEAKKLIRINSRTFLKGRRDDQS